ncbi:Oidioi.mRNA.OKI2018_I69.chr1.g3571.t1.cds [Oikopleura dioica]|uniref:Oidioi.mRNA.OKI2018_I69.chr1.g3571.t1.cds n=1 Tax=Oikopleura dioica TaxID=34765 RepID=A0ABN7SYV1_OIKDI|nr:Oidioi.mRNA.OKI2018_I69.chr1.g3571.t1.cds [Oikopleura dioica]
MRLFPGIIFFLIAESTARRPNVIILNCDDFGIGDFQIYNREAKVPTPNIDRLGKEGVKFLDAHSGSSRCAPSRYMLMTGRYSMEDKPNRVIWPDEPQLGDMFKKAGYKTGMFGKFQPLSNNLVNLNETQEERNNRKRLDNEFKEEMNKLGKSFPTLRTSNYLPGNYEFLVGPQNHSYDYSFTNSFLCCQPGGFYENGVGIEPVDTWIKQQAYPEATPSDVKSYNPKTGGCSTFPVTGYMGGDTRQSKRFDENKQDLPIYFCNFPRQQVAMKSYDTRHNEEMTIPKLERFIDDNKNEEFFVYYGMRNGHGPFNTPLRFRNQSGIGNLGESIMEADEIVGKILKKLEENDIADDTLVIFMSDNGPATSAEDIFETFGHNQRRLDLPERSIQLKGAKNSQSEAGHRTPFLWRYPRRFTPRTLFDPKIPVSTVDIYASLAELIEYSLAPDSRSLVHYIETGEANLQLQKTPILTHANLRGLNASLRKENFKYVPGSKELYNLKYDPEEKNNLHDRPQIQDFLSYLDSYMSDYLHHIEEREKANPGSRIMRVTTFLLSYSSVSAKPKGKGPACPPGLVCYGGEQYKPEECGVDGDNNGWCKGASVPPELFMQPEPPKKKPPPKAAAQKKSKKKKSSGGSGKIVAKVQAGAKPKTSKLNIVRPTKAPETSPEPEPEPAKSSGTWLYIFILALTGPLAYLGWKKYKEEQHDKMLEAGEKKEAAREEKEKQAQEKS